MMANRIRALELQYSMIQFLIIVYVYSAQLAQLMLEHT